MSSRSPVAANPMGSVPASTPASVPALSGLCTHTPTSSRSLRRVTARTALLPTPPVEMTATRSLSSVTGLPTP